MTGELAGMDEVAVGSMGRGGRRAETTAVGEDADAAGGPGGDLTHLRWPRRWRRSHRVVHQDSGPRRVQVGSDRMQLNHWPTALLSCALALSALPGRGCHDRSPDDRTGKPSLSCCMYCIYVANI